MYDTHHEAPLRMFHKQSALFLRHSFLSVFHFVSEIEDWLILERMNHLVQQGGWTTVKGRYENKEALGNCESKCIYHSLRTLDGF